MPNFILSPGRALVFLTLAVLGVLFYSPVIYYPFVHDDVALIQANPDIGRWDNIVDIFLQPVMDLGNGKVPVLYYRPVLEVINRFQ